MLKFRNFSIHCEFFIVPKKRQNVNNGIASNQVNLNVDNDALCNTDASNSPVNHNDLEIAISKVLFQSDFLESILDRLVSKVVDRLKESIDFNTKITDDLKSQLEMRDKKINDLHLLINKLRTSSEEEIEDINKYSRRSNIEIHGVPEFNSENLYEIVASIGNAIGFEICKGDVDIVHRIPSRNKSIPRPIIVKFINRWKKINFMATKNKRFDIRSSSIGFVGSDSPIFINDHLTPKMKGLLRRAKLLRGKGYKFVWCRDGKIFVRKTETTQVMTIKSVEDIDKLESG